MAETGRSLWLRNEPPPIAEPVLSLHHSENPTLEPLDPVVVGESGARLLFAHIFRLPEGPDCAAGELHAIEEVHAERGASPRVCAEVISIARGAHLPAAK